MTTLNYNEEQTRVAAILDIMPKAPFKLRAFPNEIFRIAPTNGLNTYPHFYDLHEAKVQIVVQIRGNFDKWVDFSRTSADEVLTEIGRITHERHEIKGWSKSSVVSHLKEKHPNLVATKMSHAPFTALSIKYLREMHSWDHTDMDLDKTPRVFRNVADGGYVDCPTCGGSKFIESPRSLDFYNLSCATCGTKISPLTETGASR